MLSKLIMYPLQMIICIIQNSPHFEEDECGRDTCTIDPKHSEQSGNNIFESSDCNDQQPNNSFPT